MMVPLENKTGNGTLEQRSDTKSGPRGTRLCIPRDDALFPKQLLTIPRCPDKLYVIGDAGPLWQGISIIGARKATPYGRGCARRFASIAAELGICVVSGGALGCDSEAHRGALDVGGKTVAVLGGGCDCPYPARNRGLFQSIVDSGGAVVSEQDWDAPPLPWMFRERNRIIAGMSLATLVVEAGLPSGTFSTADEALAAGRDVLAIPGSITSPTSAGSNRLIAQGATPIIDDESFESALSSLYGVLRHPDATHMAPIPDDPLIAALMASPMRTDEIMAAGFADSFPSLQIMLAQLEQQGIICRYPDGRYGPTSSFTKRR
ncbi:MAG: DNA-processing protein DprA [Coriobacteriia bacterium]|nr:DNA-processing protein DprA [Coriobacteriia bacterium]